MGWILVCWGRVEAGLDGLEELLRGYVEGNSGVYSERFSSPADFAQQLQMIPRMGGAYAEKVWMYLRWMTRPRPDLGVYRFDRRLLMVPLTSYVVDVACCLGLCEGRGRVPVCAAPLLCCAPCTE
ncbi:hypothetical protein A3K69_04615 [Candidatus Bathyarchaeota archaeon RBG_16_57_9]|nr:MAG: hypothetical protein A3K69_04615 [Candidatus Bathyarchaeota archaeon RBG_16_57_9]